MKNKVSQKLLLYPLFVVFAVYVVSIFFSNDTISSFFELGLSLFIIVIISLTLNKMTYSKVYYTFYLIALIIDFLSNILYMIPLNYVHHIADVIYLTPNLIYAGLLMFFIFNESKTWNKYQFFSDVFIILIIGFTVLWSLFIDEKQYGIGNDYKASVIIAFIFLDFCILSICSLIVLSKGIKNIPKNSLYPFAAMLIYSLSDYIFAYGALNLTELNKYFGFILYKISALLFTLGAVYESAHPYNIRNNTNNKPNENLKTPKRTFLFLGTFFLFLLIDGLITPKMMFIFLFSCLIYWGLTATIRFNELNNTLLKSEQKSRQKLEELVEERTKDLTLSYKKLEEVSNTDTLTGIYNYKYFSDFIEELMVDKEPFVFMSININRFKFVNDLYGHEVGDKVLQESAKRLSKICPKNGKIFRIGGDEFVFILSSFVPMEYISAFAENILYLFNSPFVVEPYTLKLSARIGISLCPSDSSNKNEIIRYADIANYTVKNGINKNQYCFFKQHMLDSFTQRQRVELLYRNSTPEQEFVLYFQPQFSIHDKKLIGMEALVRWVHPKIGLIPPIHFIPVLEDTGELITLGKIIAHKAFTQIKEWNEKYNLNLVIGINISPKQIEDSNFINWLKRSIKEYKVKPDWIDLELTESSYMHFNDDNKHIFNELYNLGINTSLDDFGTGYSSLSYIKALNFDRLKIAKELIDNIEDDEDSQLIIKAIIMMSDGLKVKTIAEGVENERQLDLLTKLGCDEIQGYLWGRPVPADEFEAKYIAK